MTASLPSALTHTPPEQMLDACAECDQLLLRPKRYLRRHEPVCPTCGAKQTNGVALNSLNVLAVALAAMILAIPATIYPQMSFTLLGHSNTYTLAGGGVHLLQQGFYWVGALVLLCTLLAPLCVPLLIIATALAWRWHLPRALIAVLLKLYQMIAPWVMLDVYVLAVIVALVKLQDMGHLAFSWGFYCLALMFILLTVCMLVFAPQHYWNLLEERDNAGD